MTFWLIRSGSNFRAVHGLVHLDTLSRMKQIVDESFPKSLFTNVSISSVANCFQSRLDSYCLGRGFESGSVACHCEHKKALPFSMLCSLQVFAIRQKALQTKLQPAPVHVIVIVRRILNQTAQTTMRTSSVSLAFALTMLTLPSGLLAKPLPQEGTTVDHTRTEL